MQNNINSTIDNQRNMLAGISHDLKTPLTRINLMIEELNDYDLRNSISNNISEMNLMLNHYLDFIKNEKNENLDDVNTELIINEVSKNYENLEIIKNDNHMVLVRKSQISRALINILDNANKFAKNIFLTSEILERKWIIKVDDDGPGTTLSQEEMVKPFIKGSEQLNQGTGLGLSIVQKLVKLNNGELKFGKSQYGGLRVIISLDI